LSSQRVIGGNPALSIAGIVQYLQFGYQKGLLYRLKALGERHNMDITIEGFHSWMWRGLSFLLPFLFIGYGFQAYNAWTLYKLAYSPADAPWHVSVMCGLFLLLFVGNMATTLWVVPEKIRERAKERYRLQSMGKSMKLRKEMKVSGRGDWSFVSLFPLPSLLRELF